MLIIDTYRGQLEIGQESFTEICAILAMAEEEASLPIEYAYDCWLQIGKELLRGADRLNEYALTRMNQDNAKVHNMVSLALARLGLSEPRIRALEILGVATPADAHYGGWYFVDDVLVWKFTPHCGLCGELREDHHICSSAFLQSEIDRLTAMQPKGPSVLWLPENCTDYYLDWCCDQLNRAKEREGVVGCAAPYCGLAPYSEDAPCVESGFCSEDGMP